jgi:hypothetical protein
MEENIPGEHNVHDEAPDDGEKLPAGQSVQDDERSELEKLPAEQDVQEVAPETEYVPRQQDWHEVDLSALL